MQFWETKIKSLVTPDKSFARKDFLQLIDYHATMANEQSKATKESNERIIEEMRLLREDVGALARAIANKEAGK